MSDQIRFLSVHEWIRLQPNIQASVIPKGRSLIRDEWDQDRLVNQQIMHVGEYVFARDWLNSDQYWITREEKNQNPTQGDDGTDYLDYRIDVKASLWKSGYASDYTLLVQKHEFDKREHHLPHDVAYVLPLIPHEEFLDATDVGTQQFPLPVVFMGWCRASELVDTYGIAPRIGKPRYWKLAEHLRPMSELDVDEFKKT